MLYPSSVFTENVLINVQTMVNHGTMVSVGIYLLLCNYVKCEKRILEEAFKVFSICISIAIVRIYIRKRNYIMDYKKEGC